MVIWDVFSLPYNRPPIPPARTSGRHPKTPLPPMQPSAGNSNPPERSRYSRLCLDGSKMQPLWRSEPAFLRTRCKTDPPLELPIRRDPPKGRVHGGTGPNPPRTNKILQKILANTRLTRPPAAPSKKSCPQSGAHSFETKPSVSCHCLQNSSIVSISPSVFTLTILIVDSSSR